MLEQHDAKMYVAKEGVWSSYAIDFACDGLSPVLINRSDGNEQCYCQLEVRLKF